MESIADDIIAAIRYIGEQGWGIGAGACAPHNKTVCILMALKMKTDQFILPDDPRDIYKVARRRPRIEDDYLEAAYGNKISVSQALHLIVNLTLLNNGGFTAESKWANGVIQLIAQRGCLVEVKKYIKY